MELNSKLTDTEKLYYDLLKTGAVIDRKTLAKVQAPPKRLSNIVDVHIAHMRKKGLKIRGVRGVGYQLEAN